MDQVGGCPNSGNRRLADSSENSRLLGLGHLIFPHTNEPGYSWRFSRSISCGTLPLLMRFASGTDTTPNGVHAREFWEEVYIVEGVVGSGRPSEFGEPVGQGLEAKRRTLAQPIRQLESSSIGRRPFGGSGRKITT
jgi:hypothetical protein